MPAGPRASLPQDGPPELAHLQPRPRVRLLRDRGRELEQLEMEQEYCNITSKYSPEYVRKRTLKGPVEAMKVLVSAPGLLVCT